MPPRARQLNTWRLARRRLCRWSAEVLRKNAQVPLSGEELRQRVGEGLYGETHPTRKVREGAGMRRSLGETMSHCLEGLRRRGGHGRRSAEVAERNADIMVKQVGLGGQGVPEVMVSDMPDA